MPCPTATQLEQLLADQLSAADFQVVEAHVETCADCQQALEQSSQSGPAAGPPVPLPFLEQLKQRPPDEAGVRGAESDEPGLPAVPGYTVLRALGQGGMGVVFEARQHGLNRLVALKMIRAGRHASPQERARFRFEAEAAARLQHPQIVPVYEVGEYRGQPYFSMELLEGGALTARPRAASVAAAALLIEQLSRAVHAAHQHGIIHRDLKPANILLTRDGTPKISDFGLAALVEHGWWHAEPDDAEPAALGPLTQSGAILGTPGYMAPEQAAGRRAPCTVATDVYALGALLYERLTGRPPFRGETPLETVQQVVSAEPVPPRRLQRQVPRDLETICLRCLAKAPQQRYASALALADDLERFRTGQPIQARPVRLLERAWRWCRRHPAQAALITLVPLLLLVAALAERFHARRLEAERNAALASDAAATEAEQRATVQLWEALVARADALRHSRRPGQRFAALAALQKALALPLPASAERRARLRDEAAACLVLTDVETVRDWDLDPDADHSTVAFVVDAAAVYYAVADGAGQVRIRRLTDGAEVACLPGPARPEQPVLAFSPDGTLLQVYAPSDGRLQLWQWATPRRLVLDTVAAGARLAFRADRPELGVLHTAGLLRCFDTALGQEVRCFAVPTPARRLAYHPLRAELALVCGDDVLHLDADTGRELARLPHPQTVNAVAWEPNGQQLATAGSDGVLRVWDVARQQLVRPPLPAFHADGGTARFQNAGQLLTSNDWSALAHVWEPSSGRQLLALPGIADVMAAPDRSLIQLLGRHARLLRLSSGCGLRAVAVASAAGPHIRSAACLSPDGRLLAVPTTDGLAFLELPHGVELARLARAPTWPVAFLNDQTLLTAGADGLARRPLDRTKAGQLRFGPPVVLNDELHERERYGSSRDGRVLLAPHLDRGAQLLTADGGAGQSLGPRPDVRYCAVSADGQWAATGSHWYGGRPGATVWDTRTAAALCELPVGGFCALGFSPDQRWLLTTAGGQCRLWHTGSWDEGPTLPRTGDWRHFAFSPDGKLLALAGELSQLQLIAVETGAVIARLTVPEETAVSPYVFSADGTLLIAGGAQNELIYLWDLQALRQGLRELDLDWDWPAAAKNEPQRRRGAEKTEREETPTP